MYLDSTIPNFLKAEVSLSPIQSLNGYDSPWPAGGGKNKLAPWITSQTLNAVTWTANADGSAKASGTASGSSQPFSPNIVLPNGSYIISGCPSGGSSSTYFIRVLAYNSGGTLVNNWSDYGSGATFTIDSTIDHIRVFASVNNGATAPSATWYPMIRLSSVSDATYAPYSNICPISGHTGAELNIGATYPTAVNTYSVTFTDQGTVYGGTVDFVTGKLKVTQAGKLGADFTWQYNATYKIGYTYMAGKKPGRTNIISSAYKTVDKPYSTMLNGEISGALDTGVNVKDDSTSTLAEFQAAVANVQFVYELATPIEYTLSTQQLAALA